MRLRLGKRRDLLELLDRLDELVLRARRIPRTNEIRFDRGEITRVARDLRVAVTEALEPGGRCRLGPQLSRSRPT